MKDKIQFGCGNDYLDDYINLDNNPEVESDICCDMTQYPYPFEDNQFKEALLSNVLEHMPEPIKVLEEVHRICKPGAIVKIYIPHFSHFTAYGDLTHQKYFSSIVMDYFDHSPDYYSRKAKFKIKSKKLLAIREKTSLWRKVYCFFAEPIINLSPRFTDQFLSKIILTSQIQFELEVIK